MENINLSSTLLNSTLIGSHTMANPIYNIKDGIPSGEDLYAYSQANKYYFDVNIKKNMGTVQIPTRVVTDYILKWTDSSGTAQTKTQRVERWYLVKKEYIYYSLGRVEPYTLTSINIEGELTGRVEGSYNNSKPDILSSVWGGRSNHVTIGEGYYYAGTVTLSSSNRLRPDIPEANQQKLAEKGNAACKVRNDKLIIEGSTVMSDSWVTKAGINSIGANDKSTFYKTNIVIPKNAQNIYVPGGTVIFTYENGNKIKNVNGNVNGGQIHTPVVCCGRISSPKRYNMACEPKANQIVLGTDFSINIESYGNHKNIKGYGTRDYSKYVEKYGVKMPFDVLIDNVKYKKDQWIWLDDGRQICYLPEDTERGSYLIEFMVLAVNSEGKLITGEGANILTSQYGAVSTLEVDVIGTIYGFNIYGEEVSYVGNKIGLKRSVEIGSQVLPVEVKGNKKYTLSVNSNGFGTSGDEYIKGEITYYCINDGKRQQVDLYAGTEKYKLWDSVIWEQKDKNDIGNNEYLWKKEITLANDIIVMPAGIGPDNREYELKGVNILININIGGYCVDKKIKSYINVENYKRGYCNMWKTEGFNYEFIDKNGQNITLMDGDAMIIGIASKKYEDYHIVGTH